jgi:broad specificity phosphatase PhoE
MRVYFATHATTTDNEAGMASGWRDARLSRSGIQQAEQLGHRFEDKKLDLICCSDLTRAADTVRLAFDDRLPVIVDRRLREIDYGDLNGAPVEVVDPLRQASMEKPFPDGESYQQAVARAHDFYRELKDNHSEKVALVVGHRVTQFGLDTLAGVRSLEDCLSTPFRWQPYWEYEL